MLGLCAMADAAIALRRRDRHAAAYRDLRTEWGTTLLGRWNRAPTEDEADHG